MQIRLQGIEVAAIGRVPVQFIQVLPYVVTLLVMAGLVGGRSGTIRAPRALGTAVLVLRYALPPLCLPGPTKGHLP